MHSNCKEMTQPFMRILAAAAMALLFLLPDIALAQTTRDVPQSRMFRLGEGMVRIAEPGVRLPTRSTSGGIFPLRDATSSPAAPNFPI